MMMMNLSSGSSKFENDRSAEFFPDEDPPRMIIGETSEEDHEYLRMKHPSNEPRISGDVVIILKTGRKLFKLDPIVDNWNRLPTKTELPEVIEMLLDIGMVPVNAEMEILFTDMKLPRSFQEAGELMRSRGSK